MIESGNIDEKENGQRGWFFGRLPDRELPYPWNNKHMSMKWWEAPGGSKKDGEPTAEEEDKTITILVRGKHRLFFPDTNEEFILSKEGDYVFWEPGIRHTWEALDDNLTITFRWKD